MVVSSFLFLSLCLSIVFGQYPCGFPDNSTVSSMFVASNGSPLFCNSQPVIFIPTQTRLCNQVVAGGGVGSVYYAVVVSSNNLQLNDYQFGISVTPKNATSLANFLTVYVSSTGCPVPQCANLLNPFGVGCGFEHIITSSNVVSVTDSLTTGYLNAANGVYYIQVVGSANAILFDIEINNGTQTLARFVAPISVLLFCFVFAIVVLFIFLWKKTHGGWLHEDELPVVVPKKVGLEKTMSNKGLLRMDSGLSTSSAALNVESLQNVVDLFREQTATINRLTEIPKLETTQSEFIREEEDVKPKKEEEKKKS